MTNRQPELTRRSFLVDKPVTTPQSPFDGDTLNETQRGQKRAHREVEGEKPSLFQRFKSTAMKVFNPFSYNQFMTWDWPFVWGTDRNWRNRGTSFDTWRDPSSSGTSTGIPYSHIIVHSHVIVNTGK